MPLFEFRMLCMNNKPSCDFVKKLMSDFTNIRDVNMVDFDHIGIGNFDNTDDALIRLKRIKTDAGEHLLDSAIVKVT